MRTVPSIGRSCDLARGIALAGLIIGSGGAPPVLAAVIAVPADQPTIQLAVDAAAAGDAVRIAPGVYPERVRITGARDGLTIEAADPADPPVVQGKATTSTDGIQVQGVDGVTLRALRIVNANTGVRLTRVENAVLDNLHLENDGLGIRIVNGGGNTVRGSVVEGTSGRQGMLVEWSPNTTIADTVVHAPKREGIAIRNASGAVVLHVTVDGSQGSDGILVYRSKDSRIEDATVTNNARNGLRASSSLDLTLVRATANDNGSAGLRIERCSPFDDVADVLAAGNTAAGNRGRDIVVEPLRCNQSQCPPTTMFTTSTTTSPMSSTTTTTSITLVPPPSTTTTTIPSPPLADASWRFYVRITTGDPFPHNVDVPAHSTDPPLDVMIRADQLPAFRPGDQVTGLEIAALGGDTLDRLTAAVDAYLRSHAADYPGFGAIVEIRWAKRLAP
jgi:Periplasmic copper-binding protein (NosD)